jgi:hypothetical protein
MPDGVTVDARATLGDALRRIAEEVEATALPETLAVIPDLLAAAEVADAHGVPAPADPGLGRSSE